MFFQINVTPKQKTVKVTEESEQIQPEQRFTLILAPFQPQTRIKLESTVYNAVRCLLIIKNTGNRNLNVTVTKSPPKERSIELSALELLVEAEREAELGITWTPQEGGSWRDTLQLTDSRRIKYDVALITAAKDPSKRGGKAKSRVLGLSNSNASCVSRTRKKSPPPVRQSKKNPSDASLCHLNVPNKRPRLNVQPNKENAMSDNWICQDKPLQHFESYSKTEALNFSSIINSTNFNFTPVKIDGIKDRIQPDIKIKEEGSILTFSPHNSKIFSPNKIEESSNLRRDTYVTESKFHKQFVITEEKEDVEEFEDSLSPQPAVESFDCSMFNLNFTTPKSENLEIGATNFSPNACSTGNRTKSGGSTNSSRNLAASNTFNISAHLESSSRANGTYELLPTSPTRSPNSNSLKPTRLSKNFGTLSPIASEISDEWKKKLAASSPKATDVTPLDFSRRISITHQKNYDEGSVKDVLEANLWVQSETQHLTTATTTTMTTFSFMGRRNSLEKIVEESDSSETKSDTSLNKTTTLTSKETRITEKKAEGNSRCMEISPPKKSLSKSKDSSIRRISPTKGTKIRKDRSVLESSASLRKKVQMNCSIKCGNVSIPGVRIANLSLAGLNKSSTVKNKSLKSETSKVSVKLRDPNDIFTIFRNLDLFAATLTQDPFLTPSIYYDEEWMSNQEKEFKKWLNALLSPPEHLDADVDTICVDVGKVWESCRAKDNLTLAESRETVSARYHTNTRLDTLRKAAGMMIRRQEVKLALTKAAMCVERGILMIRQDRDLPRDIGLQKQILELFLSYNPLWLRIGLETIYGETIPLQSNNDLVGLTRFLISRFFSDPSIAKTHSHALTSSLKLPTFISHMNKFILKKFLLLVFFLDYAKRNKLIGHDPCLFHKRAVYKDSRSILLSFSRELLSGVGDVTKVLRAHDYVVSHKQTYLDEYDYAVNNIATDLRDGVRLCRVMELITGDRNLTCRCRVPAISRLQKVHNADVALKALLRCGYTIIGDIDAKSVADGHREKTLSLLWQIIYKYQAPKFEKSAKSIQKWWRSLLWYVRVRNFLRDRKKNAASTIQRAWKCYKSRKILKELRDERNRRWAEKEEAVRTIQLRWIQRMRSKRNASLIIQAWWRNWNITREHCNQYLAFRRSVIFVQRQWRANLIAKRSRLNYLTMKKAATKIQASYRMFKERKKYLKKIEAAVILQRRWRETLIAREARKNDIAYRSACVFIQNRYRDLRNARSIRNDYLLKRRAVIIIQKNWRMLISLREYKKHKAAAIALQSAWRCRKLCMSTRMKYLALRNATIIVQRRYRANKIGLETRQKYLQLRSLILFVQRQWRAKKLMKEARARYLEYQKAAVILQSQWRMILENRKYRLIRKSVSTIQTKWRAFVAARKARATYVSLKMHIILIQRRYRNKRCCKIVRQEYINTRDKIIAIQRLWRIKLENRMREEAAINIQTWWRSIIEMRKCRQSFESQRSAIVVIQKRYRAFKIGIETRRSYLHVLRSIVKIQRCWRHVLQRRRYEEWLRDCKEAVLILENWWIKVLENRRRNRAAVKIQSVWRGYNVRINQSETMKALRGRSEKAAKAAVPSATVAYQLKGAMEMLLITKSMGHLLMCLTVIDTLTRLSLEGSIRFCTLNLVENIYWTLAKANRAKPWLDVCVRSASILITLAKLPDTRNYIYKVEYIETLARLMTVAVDYHVELFQHLSTLLWLLAENPEYAEAIRSCPRTTWLLKSLYTSINKKHRASLAAPNKSRAKEGTAPLPNSKPDWGLRQKRPRLFKTVHHAITSLMNRLKIDFTK